MSHILALALIASLMIVGVGHAEAPVALHVLAIGYNGAPSAADAAQLHELRYADDDAAAFAQFAADAGGQAIILSNFDVDTAQRFPALVDRARPPLFAELYRAVAELNAAFARDRSRGEEPVLLLSYSGHGMAAAGSVPALTLADGALTHETLYEDVLSALTARFIHVIVDACHAEAVVRSRDAQAQTVALGPEEIAASVSRATLSALPHMGALVASSASTQSHEWEAWQQGVFTHEVLSGLRGAADVNGDMRIEYSEMAAFLTATNREVANPIVRIKPLLKPPSAMPRAPIVELRRKEPGAFLAGFVGRLGAVSVETDQGQRIADLHAENGQYVRLLVPSTRRLFVRSSGGEIELTIAPGHEAHFDATARHASSLEARGALDLSLRRGLFATAFGPSYYRGFVDRSDELQAVPLSPAQATNPLSLSDRRGHVSRVPAWTALGLSAALLGTSAAFGISALDAKSDFEHAGGLEQRSFAAKQRYDDQRALALGTVIASALVGGLAYVLFEQP